MVYGLFASIAFTIITVVYGRWFRRGRPRIPQILGLWLGCAVGLAGFVAAVEQSQTLAVLATNLATYLFLSEVYLFVYALSFGSLSIQLIVSMAESEPSPDALHHVLTQYSANAFLNVRLDSLLAQRLLVERGGRYRVTARGRRVAALGITLKKLLAVGTGG
jgi:hypothetical protein